MAMLTIRDEKTGWKCSGMNGRVSRKNQWALTSALTQGDCSKKEVALKALCPAPPKLRTGRAVCYEMPNSIKPFISRSSLMGFPQLARFEGADRELCRR
jgi:hypothetical protein